VLFRSLPDRKAEPFRTEEQRAAPENDGPAVESNRADGFNPGEAGLPSVAGKVRVHSSLNVSDGEHEAVGEGD
jgi:hypothetical protein